MRINVDKNKPLNRMPTVAEVAYALHVHPTTVRKWEKPGQLKSYRLGARGNVRFKTEDISLFTDSSGKTPVPARELIDAIKKSLSFHQLLSSG